MGTNGSSRAEARAESVLAIRQGHARPRTAPVSVMRDFTCIRNVQLDRFTIDRLMIVLNKLGQHVDVQIDVRPRAAAEETPVPP